ncbi:GntR family transcriptional regulator [Herbiconiux moechotypicola]|uniref:GntR family transcriptional regulator n=1 Tax=Herbiconiux moechotypicola TaxID=637393 RepID=A0ABN3DEX7_9MICO|nr:GntR family transcriptional regulator [Herbiconiux moechotypicola]MCS5729362.1 GntR family transcriptional regulator [Herbiconiux moechotypicola]
MAGSKAEQAYQILKERIMDGTYGPGRRLVIDQLGREYNISSIPWRESLRRLEAEGWVDIVRHSGAVVKSFDTETWQRTMRLLARLEGLATALSGVHLTPDDLTLARSLNREMGEALANFDPGRFGVLNRRFHAVLCSRCDDERLNDLVSAEWTRLELVRRSAFWYAPGRALASISEHDAILDLIEGGADPELVETAARRHDINTLEAVTSYDAELSASGETGAVHASD